MPSLRIVALSVIILGSLACSEEQSTTTTVTTGADVCVDDATYFAQTLWPGVLQNKCLGCHNAQGIARETEFVLQPAACLLYTSPSPRDRTRSRMPSSA